MAIYGNLNGQNSRFMPFHGVFLYLEDARDGPSSDYRGWSWAEACEVAPGGSAPDVLLTMRYGAEKGARSFIFSRCSK